MTISQVELDAIFEGMTQQEFIDIKEGLAAYKIARASGQLSQPGAATGTFLGKDLSDITQGVKAFAKWMNGDERTVVTLPNGRKVPCLARAADIAKNKTRGPVARQARAMIEGTGDVEIKPGEVSDMVDDLDDQGLRRLVKHLLLRVISLE